MDRRRAQEHRRWRNHGRSWIFFFGGKLLRKLLVMAPRSFTGGDRRRIVDRKHHRPWNTVTGAPSHRIAFLSHSLSLSLSFFQMEAQKENGELGLRDSTKPAGHPWPIPILAHPAQYPARKSRKKGPTKPRPKPAPQQAFTNPARSPIPPLTFLATVKKESLTNKILIW